MGRQHTPKQPLFPERDIQVAQDAGSESVKELCFFNCNGRFDQECLLIMVSDPLVLCQSLTLSFALCRGSQCRLREGREPGSCCV